MTYNIFEDLHDGFLVDKIIFLKTSKKLLENTHREANYSIAIDMKVHLEFGTRR
jgi:hypothetical protein